MGCVRRMVHVLVPQILPEAGNGSRLLFASFEEVLLSINKTRSLNVSNIKRYMYATSFAMFLF